MSENTLNQNGNLLTNETDFQLSPGEANPYGARFYENIIMPWIKAQMMCSSTRFVFRDPNMLLGVIPVGGNENSMPLRNIASVSTSTKSHVGRLLAGLILLILGFTFMGQGGGALVAGLIALVLAVSFFANTMDAVLVVQNAAGGFQSLQVSIFDKAKLETFKNEFNNRLMADQAQTHHDEAQQMRM